MKLIVLFCSLILFAGCKSLSSSNSAQVITIEPENNTNCIWQGFSKVGSCSFEFWLQYWSKIEDMSWPERQAQIDILSEQDADIMKKILLSQGKSTPYQARLRAQRWLEKILPKLTQQMQRFFMVALYHPSQGLLELESALVTLSKINTHQSFNIEEQQIQLDKQQIQLDKQQKLLIKQRSQIDQLLNIETSIMESVEKEKE